MLVFTTVHIPGEPEKSLHFFKSSVTANGRPLGNYLFIQISYGHNLPIRLIESIPGIVSSELALPDTNSDLVHKYLFRRNIKAPGTHCLS